MSSRVHVLKCRDEHFVDILLGLKTFELRFDDRGYRAGDVLELHEIETAEGGQGTDLETGRRLRVRVLGVMRGKKPNGLQSRRAGSPHFALEEGWVILSIRIPRVRSRTSAVGSVSTKVEHVEHEADVEGES